MLKVVYHLVDSFARDLFYLVATQAAESGIQFEIATESPVISNHMKHRGIRVAYLRDQVRKSLADARGLDTKAKQDFLATEFGVSVEDMTYSDVVISKKPLAYRATMSMAYATVWTEYLKTTSPDLVLGTDGTETPNIALCTAAARLGIPIVYTCGGSVFPGTIYWDRSIMLGEWVRKEYMEHEPSDADREKVLQYIRRLTAERPVLGGLRPGILSRKRWAKAMRYYWDCVIKGRSRYYVLSPKAFFEPFLSRIRARAFYSQLDSNDKIIFFPLHVPNDAQITLRAPHFLEQYRPVEMCSRNIPEGYTLYVKEHPHARARVPVDWLRKITSLPNVKLVAPHINAHDLIERSHCIITVNSDVGWEALLHCKPVVVLAKPFYSGAGVTFDVDCFRYSGVSHVTFDQDSEKRLHTEVRQAIAQESVDEEAVIRLVDAAMKSPYPGSYYDSQADFNCESTNIKNLVDSIRKAYSNLGNAGEPAMLQP